MTSSAQGGLGLDSTLPDPDPAPRSLGSNGSVATVRVNDPIAVRPSRGKRQRCPTCGHDFPLTYKVCPRDATPLGLAQPNDPLIGTVLAGTYRLTRVVGRGGMGRLYEAEHTRLARSFAVKILHEAHADKLDAVRRFEREADALARIRSDFVLDVVDVLRTVDGRTAIVTGLLEGEDLQRRLDRRHRLTPEEAISIGRQLCRGVAAAHAAGVVHRDLKPSNLFLSATPDGQLALKILDFGVAKLTHDDQVTRTGVVLGTPAFMAPEQARGSSGVDPRCDIYAIGAVLYRMVTGKTPYSGNGDPSATLAALLVDSPAAPRSVQPELPVALEVVIQRAMAREPDERPQSALELESALASLVDDSPPTTVKLNELDTGVLPFGVVERAQSMEREARAARPAAGIYVVAASVASGGLVAAALSNALTPGDDATRALSQALAIVGGITSGVVSLTALARWFAPRWGSAPAVLHSNRRLGRALMSGLAILGAAWLAMLTQAAVAGRALHDSWSILITLLLAAAIALTVLRLER